MRTRVTGIFCASLVCLFALASAALADGTTSSPLDNKEPGKGETSIGSLVADAFRAATRADVAFVSAGDLKVANASLIAGKVQSSDIKTLLVYPEDDVVVLALDGGMIRAALERSVASYPRSGLSFLQVSGLKFTFDPSRADGDRVTAVTVGSAPVANDQSYTVAMPNSLAGGALGYWKVWSKRNIVAKSGPVSSGAAVDQFLKNNRKLDYGTLNRITAAKP
jgi:2',3'-cyclic-nucleotide 2'-phosphodiesterase (5'-nucleotidase family)